MTDNEQTTGAEADNAVSREVIVANEHGLHARPAGKLAQQAQAFEAEIRLISGEQEVDAKSILDVLTLAAGPGDRLEIRCSGADAADAAEALHLLFKTKFNE